MSAKDSESAVDPGAVHDEEAPGPAISVPESNDTGEGGKLKMIMQLVKKCVGVKDIAAMCVSHRTYALPRTELTDVSSQAAVAPGLSARAHTES